MSETGVLEIVLRPLKTSLAGDHIVYVDVLEADSLTSVNHRKKKVSCLFQNGDLIYGKDAYKQKHPDLHISASQNHKITWVASRPFQIRFKGNGSNAFIDPEPWKSHRRKNGLHVVVSSPVRPGVPKPPRKSVKVSFRVIATLPNPPHNPDPTIQALDPHVIIEP